MGAEATLIRDMSSTVAAEMTFICDICGQVCLSKRGLGMHRHHRHPLELNEDRLATLAARRLNWTPEDDASLVFRANQIWAPTTTKKDLVQRLREFFPTRSAEAIRKRLQLIKWTPSACSGSVPSHSPTRLPELDASPIVPSPPPPDLSDVPRPSFSFDVEAWRSKLLRSCASSLLEPKLGAMELRSIVEGLLANSLDTLSAIQMLEDHATLYFPHCWNPSRCHSRPTRIPRSTKQIRRANYAAVQRLYKLRRKEAAKTVLSGCWRTAFRNTPSTVAGMDEFWTKVFSCPSAPDSAHYGPPPDFYWSLLNPITVDEVSRAIYDSGDTAAGLDRLTISQLKTWHYPSLASYFNLLLVVGVAPVQLSTARVAFIPKTDCPTSPADFRPISISSVLLRTFHKILARRIVSTLEFSEFQYAFLQKDGCLEASTLLHTILRKAHDDTTPLSMLFLDVAKAFDTISHETLFKVATSCGLPPPLTNYLTYLYQHSYVHLDSGSVKCGRGVRQGDPLSPLLFIMCIDALLKAAEPDIGLRVDTVKIGALAYADDLVLLANNPEHLQKKLTALHWLLQSMGMSLNPRKSKGLTILKDRRSKCLVLSPTCYQAGDGSIDPMRADEHLRYLGLDFTWKGRCTPKHTNTLQGMLFELSKAPLKPYQRLDLLKTFASPN